MTSNNPTVSVVIPAYNTAPTLCRCLDCLLAQTTTVPYEIVVSDDGSTDDTSQLMSAYEAKGVRYLQHKNVGRAQNRNIGAENARGMILVFLDADTLPVPGFLSAQSQAWEQAGKQGVVSGAIPVAQECEILSSGTFSCPQVGAPIGGFAGRTG